MARVVHAAAYGFAAPAEGLVLDLRLAPATWEAGRAAAALSIVPPPARLRPTADRWGNRVDRALFARPVARLSLSMLLEAAGPPAPLPDVPPAAADLALPPDAPQGAPLGAGGAGGAPAAPAALRGGDRAAGAVAAAALAALRDGWRFVPPGGPEMPLAALAAAKRGLCLELSRLLVWRLRAAGVPARFVLGYALDAHRRGAARERHAWAAFHDGRGWREIDAAAPERPPAERLATAWGPDLAAILPVRARRPAGLVTARAEWSTQIDP
jgi:transglutaminase-like putative cysteine protease